MASATAKRVTRDVEPDEVGDLLTHPPRATVAFVDADEVELVPARARLIGSVHTFAVRADDAPELAGREVVLVRDDGRFWYELRGITVRGDATRADAPSGEPADDLAWYAIAPRRVLAWDYGSLHDVPPPADAPREPVPHDV